MASLLIEAGQQIIGFAGCAAGGHKPIHAGFGCVEPGLDTVKSSLERADDEQLDPEEHNPKPHQNAEPEILAEGSDFRVIMSLNGCLIYAVQS